MRTDPEPAAYSHGRYNNRKRTPLIEISQVNEFSQIASSHIVLRNYQAVELLYVRSLLKNSVFCNPLPSHSPCQQYLQTLHRQ